jgi:DNA repair photolyase
MNSTAQGELFGMPPVPQSAPGAWPDKVGRAEVKISENRSILTSASGFMAGYDFTLNPYTGCTFGCAYCYAAAFVPNEEEKKRWGKWVKVKKAAVRILEKEAAKLTGKAIYMSSVTDPYQPVEKATGITRAILEILTSVPDLRLTVQTRGPLVTRDADLMAKLGRLRVNLTVTTDYEEDRKKFEPLCPSVEARLDAARELAEKGLDVGVTITPLIRIREPVAFAEKLFATGAQRFVVQPFHASSNRGRGFRATTREEAIPLAKEMGWTQRGYEETVGKLRAILGSRIEEGRGGFAPPAV